MLYAVYMSALLAVGAAVALGGVPANDGRGLGLLGAVIAVGVVATILILFAAPSPVGRALDRIGRRPGRLAAASRGAIARLPVLRAALRHGWHEVRRPHPALLGAVAWWGFDIAVLGTMLHAFGARMPLVALVLAYLLGTMFDMVPLPGILSGGLVGSLIALGTPSGSAIAAVLAYRALAVWLPALPGMVSLARLRTSVVGWRMDTASRTLARQVPV